MKPLIIITFFTALLLSFAPDASAQERFGKTFNLGLGVGGHSGYSRYASRALPVISLNYEFDVARNFTLAPFISFYTYSDKYYYSTTTYAYRETVIPIGVKGTYYFDELFNATGDWDFYASASAGFAIVNSHWETGYLGDKNYYHSGSPVFVDLHIGTEYHFNNKMGVYLDLSSGISTLGLAFHQSR
jgi:hypothetical protein